MTSSMTKDPGVSPGCCLPITIIAFLSNLVSTELELTFIMGIDLPIKVVPTVVIVTLGWSLMLYSSLLRSLRS